MMQTDFDARVAALTEYARRHPRGYRIRVALLAVLGYAYLVGVVLVLLGVVGLLGWMAVHRVGIYLVLKLAIPALALVWLVLRSLPLRFQPPEGEALDPRAASELLAEVEHVRRKMQAPVVHHVLVDDNYNACVAQVPRWGVLGGYRTYLVIGLPLLNGLTPEEFRAVLAHEFGHVSRAHGRFGAWIYRLRASWDRILGALEADNSPAQALFSRFFRWYAPFFSAYSFVLVRADEYEADRMAAGVASPEALGSALCRMEVTARYLDRRFWPDLFAGARTEPEPPADVQRRLAAALRNAPADPAAGGWLREAMHQPTRSADSHPALRDRLAALGVPPRTPEPLAGTAAERLLQRRADALADRLDAAWARAGREWWRERNAQLREMADRLHALDRGGGGAGLGAEEARERITLTLELRGTEMAIPMMRDHLSGEREDALVQFLLGRALLDADDEHGVPHLEYAMQVDEEYTVAACDAIAAFHERAGRHAEAAPYRQRQDAYFEILQRAQEERRLEALSPRDVFVPHGLDADALATLRTQLDGVGASRVYLARKEVRYLPNDPLWVLAVVPAWTLDALRPGNASQRLVDRIVERVQLPGSLAVVACEGLYRKLGRAVKRVPGAEVYRRRSLLRR